MENKMNNSYIERMQSGEPFESVYEDAKKEVMDGIRSGQISGQMKVAVLELMRLLETNGPYNEDDIITV